MYRLIFFFLVGMLLTQCVPADQAPITSIKNDISDAEWQRVHDLVDKHDVDSLLLYTSHADPTYRLKVAQGLASIRDKKAIDSLYVLLQDPVLDVRVAAAYALGQLKDPAVANTLLRSFRSKDTLSVDNNYNAAILEAIGKTGNENLLKNIATVSTYRATDTLLLLGQSRAIYRYGLRGITAPEGTDRMVELLTDPTYPESVRMVAVNYLMRARDLNLTPYQYRLAEVFTSDKNPHIRMFLARILGKTKSNEMLKILKQQYNTEDNYQVKTSIIQSLSDFPYIRVIDMVLKNLSNPNHHIANAAADYLIKNGNRTDATIYRNFTNDTLSSSVNAKIYSSVLKNIPVNYANTKNIINAQLVKKYEDTEGLYEKLDYLKALGYDPYNYKKLGEIASETDNPIIRSGALEALKSIVGSPSFKQAFRSRSDRVKLEILETLKTNLKKNDVAVASIVGGILANEDLGYKNLVDSTQFLQEAIDQLQLPKDMDSYNSLQKAMAHLKGTTYEKQPTEYNHPIDYSHITNYGDSILAAVKTTAGSFKIKLYPKLAPGSVANFIQLSNDNFYDGKYFHRVVPNFVVQAGCSRGDGYGILDYTIRSEVGQAYYDDGGYLGMASSGADTESNQWFITHNPTMHLDGGYSIFGKVMEGMETIHKIKAGDQIQDIIITKQ